MDDEKELMTAPEEVAEAAAEVAEVPAECMEAVEAVAEVTEAPAGCMETAEAVAEVTEAPAECVEAVEAAAEVTEAPAECMETAEAAAEVEEAPAECVEAVEAVAEVEEAPAECVEAVEAAAEVTEAPAEAKEETPVKEEKTAKDRAFTVLGVILCLILAPILIANITMIVKSYTDSDKVPSFGGYCPFIVLTDSMVPTINGGDLVIDKVVTDAAEIQKGDIISFFDPASRSQSIVTHRVIEITKDENGIAFRTQGDANNTEDDDLIPAKNVVGIYSFKLSGVGNVVMFMQSTTGLVVCIALPILLIIGYDALRRRKYEKQQQADTDALMKELEELRAKQGK